MTQSWMDVVGPSVVSSLSQQCSVKLTPRLVNFLERFADKVDAAIRARHIGARSAARFAQELRSVNEIVREEVYAIQRTSLFSCDDLSDLYVRRHVETCLPIVHLRVRQLPELVVHVFRSYCTTRRGVTYGHRLLEYCGGRATGPVARAINHLRERCREVQWQMSVTELLTVWMETATVIPLEERAKCGQSRPRYLPDMEPEYHPPPAAASLAELETPEVTPPKKPNKRQRQSPDAEDLTFHPEFIRRDSPVKVGSVKGKSVKNAPASGSERNASRLHNNRASSSPFVADQKDNRAAQTRTRPSQTVRKVQSPDSEVQIIEDDDDDVGNGNNLSNGVNSGNGRFSSAQMDDVQEEVIASGGGNPRRGDAALRKGMYESEEVIATGGGDKHFDGDSMVVSPSNPKRPKVAGKDNDGHGSDSSLSYQFNRNEYADAEEEIVAVGGDLPGRQQDDGME